MTSQIILINKFRIKFSSQKNIFKSNDKKYENFDNSKIISINNFELKIKSQIIRYSLLYTNPFVLEKKIIKKIKFDSTSNFVVKNLLKKIFFSNNSYKLTNFDNKTILNLLKRKNKYDKYIGFEESILIMWYIIMIDHYILEKNFFYKQIKKYYHKFLLGKFKFNEIIKNIIREQSDLKNYKFYLYFYIFVEEFHYKYIQEKLNNIFVNHAELILNSNYIILNPQEILNNCENKYLYELIDLSELIDIPLGHNILFIISNKKIFYYDSDEQILSDQYRLKKFFNNLGYNFFSISNIQPIQILTDDTNCVFYCLRFIEYIKKNNIKLNLQNLKSAVIRFENNIFYQNDIFDWTKKFIEMSSQYYFE